MPSDLHEWDRDRGLEWLRWQGFMPKDGMILRGLIINYKSDTIGIEIMNRDLREERLSHQVKHPEAIATGEAFRQSMNAIRAQPDTHGSAVFATPLRPDANGNWRSRAQAHPEEIARPKADK